MTANAEDILETILTTKRQEVLAKSERVSLAEIQAQAQACTLPLRGFRAAIAACIRRKEPAVIAELKKASPSQGVIRENFDIFALSRAFVKGNATCLSVLTDKTYFQGHDGYLVEVRETVSIPLLRKDFIILPYQVFESRVLGADAILLIAAALPVAELEVLHGLARSVGLDVLIEVHTIEEYQAVAHLASDAVIGVNNRNLKTFEVDLNTTLTIARQMPPGQVCITESGINERLQVQEMFANGIFGFLVGEALMRYDDPEQGLQALFPEKRRLLTQPSAPVPLVGE